MSPLPQHEDEIEKSQIYEELQVFGTDRGAEEPMDDVVLGEAILLGDPFQLAFAEPGVSPSDDPVPPQHAHPDPI